VICGGKGMQMLVESLQGAFPADRIAEEHGHKVNHLILAETTTSKAHTLSDGGKHIVLTKTLCDQDDFPEPGGKRGY
jgi:hypothetical protein